MTSGSRLLQIGEEIINLDHVISVRMEGDEVHVNLTGSGSKALSIRAVGDEGKKVWDYFSDKAEELH